LKKSWIEEKEGSEDGEAKRVIEASSKLCFNAIPALHL